MFKVKDEIYWVGIKDWDLRTFHGEELSTHHGSSYNAYLIKDEKMVLVDTAWKPFKEEFISNLEKNIDLKKIDYIVINHCEIDHSGALPALLHRIPDVPIYCTQKGKEMIYKHFHKDWNFKVVKTGDTLNLGKNELIFIEAPMLHWPDSMFTYVKGANVLLSNDAFGQHYATSGFFDDQADQCQLEYEAIKYYANILAPFSKLVKQKIEQLNSLNLPIEMIAPSHGIIWRKDPQKIVNKYYQWAQDYHENNVVIIYDTMWDATKKMADAIAEGLAQEGISYKLLNAAKTDKNDMIVEAFKAKGILIGSSTINNGILTSIAAFLEEMTGMKFTKKIGAAFGSYGWSGEAIKVITKRLQEAKFEIVNDGIKFKYNPTEEELKECVAFGREIAQRI